ncbi:predicted protein [Plenodomus lingam JN3]|uniref:Predicted protein n=1 Tax=Leptosphaeria maculans (strain JN3 / isolate v23.1.3 / race Av1-4-5-6-7-8) TaxID=985895 RepID=E5ADG9_LEPMJ|nr:predicted protein [Plenodomus lingam JN3]CBY01258.1 predicted protein [Plenodomus lingam JN3]
MAQYTHNHDLYTPYSRKKKDIQARSKRVWVSCTVVGMGDVQGCLGEMGG